MLNSEELQQLRITTPIKKLEGFPNITTIIASHNNVQLMGKDHNANIRAFYYILLLHIFGNNLDSDPISSSSSSRSETVSDAQYKLYRIKHLLFSSDIDLSIIQSIPKQVERAIDEYLDREVYKGNQDDVFLVKVQGEQESNGRKNRTINLYLKKLIIEMLTRMWKECSKVSSDSCENNSKVGNLKKQKILKFFRQFGVADPLFCIFIRSVLYKEYQISDALDFNAKIADHTLYMSLCDAFGYSGLRLEENECTISNDSTIHICPIQRIVPGGFFTRQTQEEAFYLISLQNYTSTNTSHQGTDNQEFETFRNKKKTSLYSLGDLTQHREKDSLRIKSQNQQLQIRDERSKGNEILILDSSFDHQEIQSKEHNFSGQNNNAKFQKEQNQVFPNSEAENKNEAILVTPRDKKTPRIQIGLDANQEYSSYEVIMQLSPKVREAMLSSPKYKKFNFGSN